MWVNHMTDTDKTSLKCYKNSSKYWTDALSELETPNIALSSTRQISDLLTLHPTVWSESTKIRNYGSWQDPSNEHQWTGIFEMGLAYRVYSEERLISRILCRLSRIERCYRQRCLTNPSDAQAPFLTWQSSYVFDTQCQLRLFARRERRVGPRQNYVYIAYWVV